MVGCRPKNMLNFFKSYFRSILDYGCILYGSANNMLLKKLDTLQNKALRICIGAMCSTPIGALLTECNEPPLHIRRKLLSGKFIMNSQAKNSNILSKVNALTVGVLTKRFWRIKNSPPLCTAWSDLAEYYGVIDYLPREMDDYLAFYNKKTRIVYPKYSDCIELNQEILNNALSNLGFSRMCIYTDASKTKDGVGGAFYVPSSNTTMQFGLPANTSIFSAEAYAILKALLYVETQNIHNFIILSDSQSVLKAIQNFINPLTIINRFILLVKRQIHRLRTAGCDFSFIWVKAHVGIVSNETVDLLAKGACQLVEFDCLNISSSDIINIYKRFIKQDWKQWWNNYCISSPTRYTTIQPNLPDKPWFDELFTERRGIVSMIRMRIGHGSYPVHLHRINLIDSNECQYCQSEVADIDHLLFGCQGNYNECADLYKKIMNQKVPSPLNSAHVLSLNNLEIYKLIIQFLNQTGIKI